MYTLLKRTLNFQFSVCLFGLLLFVYALLPSSSKRVSYPFPIFNTEKREGSSFLGRLSATDQQIPKAGRSEKTSLEIFHLRHFVPTLFDNVCAVRHFSCLYCPPAPLKVPWGS